MPTAKKKSSKIAGITLEPTSRKKNRPSTAFMPGNPHRFEKGVSGNPGGKPKTAESRLLSRAMRVQLSWRAPDDVALQLGLTAGASWAQCISMRLIRLAIRDADVSAMRELREATEGTRQRFEIFDDEGNPQETPPLIELVFVNADGDGHPAPGQVIDGNVVTALPAVTTVRQL